MLKQRRYLLAGLPLLLISFVAKAQFQPDAAGARKLAEDFVAFTDNGGSLTWAQVSTIKDFFDNSVGEPWKALGSDKFVSLILHLGSSLVATPTQRVLIQDRVLTNPPFASSNQPLNDQQYRVVVFVTRRPGALTREEIFLVNTGDQGFGRRGNYGGWKVIGATIRQTGEDAPADSKAESVALSFLSVINAREPSEIDKFYNSQVGDLWRKSLDEKAFRDNILALGGKLGGGPIDRKLVATRKNDRILLLTYQTRYPMGWVEEEVDIETRDYRVVGAHLRRALGP